LEKMGISDRQQEVNSRLGEGPAGSVITTGEEHERLLAEVEKLMDRGDRRTAEEDAALDLMVRPDQGLRGGASSSAQSQSS
jgi:hypothetical protein